MKDQIGCNKSEDSFCTDGRAEILEHVDKSCRNVCCRHNIGYVLKKEMEKRIAENLTKEFQTFLESTGIVSQSVSLTVLEHYSRGIADKIVIIDIKVKTKDDKPCAFNCSLCGSKNCVERHREDKV